MTELLASFFAKWTPGATGIWTLVILALVLWWQGLPKILDALTNRQSKVEERMGALLNAATERFEREIAAADKRHDECIAGQEKMQDRIRSLEECLSKQQDTISGLKRQLVQMQISAVRVEGTPMSPLVQGAIDQLDALPNVKIKQ